MPQISTKYMGLELKSPVVVAACSLSGKIENFQHAESAGAGAMVIKSLFEEQLMVEAENLQYATHSHDDEYAESTSFFPPQVHAGPKEHLMWVKRTREKVQMPLIGSINAINPQTWVDFAAGLQDAGVDALELNTYAVQTDLTRPAGEIEDELVSTVSKVVKSVGVPVSVKLSPYYSSVVNVASRISDAGAAGLVMFNRFLQPDIDIDNLTLRNTMDMMHGDNGRVALRYIALLSGKVKADLISNGGINKASGVIKQLLAGASAVQVASVLYSRGIDFIGTLNEGLCSWMSEKGYNSLDDFRGIMSQQDLDDPFAFERAQYVELLMSQV